jgi:DNA gyrase subunit A
LSDAETLVGVVSIEAVEEDEELETIEQSVENTELDAVNSEEALVEPKDDNPEA